MQEGDSSAGREAAHFVPSTEGALPVSVSERFQLGADTNDHNQDPTRA